MSVETIEHCDLCNREVPLRGVKGQTIYRGRFSSWWYWWGSKEESRGPLTFCGECWNVMRAQVRAAVAARTTDAPGASPIDSTPVRAGRDKPQ